MEFSGYKTVHPIELIWRDALEVVKQLFSDPIFTNHMTYTPHVVNVGNQREYGDYMSADMAWRIQVRLLC
jgi:Plavaka transposase